MNTDVTNRELAAGEGCVWCRESAFGLRPIRPNPEGIRKMFGLRKQETADTGIEIAKSRISNRLTALFHGFWAKKEGHQVWKISKDGGVSRHWG